MLTQVQIFKDIGFNADYNNVIDFANLNEQNSWFDSKVIANYNNVNYDKFPTNLKLEVPSYIEALKYTYMRVNYNNEKWLYFFIQGCTIVKASPDITICDFRIVEDAWQTYLFEFTVKPSPMIRGHVDRWQNGKPRLAVPYRGDIAFNRNVYSEQSLIDTTSDGIEIMWVCICALFTYEEAPDAIKNFVIPILNPGYFFQSGHVWLKSSGGTEVKCPTMTDVLSNTISTILGVPTKNMLSVELLSNSPYKLNKVSGSNEFTYELINGRWYIFTTITNEEYALIQCEWEVTDNRIIPISDIYKPSQPTNGSTLSKTAEPMMYMNPLVERFMMCEDDGIIFKVPDNYALLCDYPELMVSLLYQNSNTKIKYEFIDRMDSRGVMEGTTFYKQSKMFNVVYDQWQDYCLTSRQYDTSMRYNNYMSETFSKAFSMGFGGALVGSRANGGSALAIDNINPMLSGAGMGVAGGLMSGLVTSYFDDKNAKLNEQKMMNQSIHLIASGDARISYYDKTFRLVFVITKTDDEVSNRYFKQFTMYGYDVGIVQDINLRSRKHFNYIKTAGAIISGSINNTIKEKIAKILDGGTTIWHMDYATIGDYSKENIERSLM